MSIYQSVEVYAKKTNTTEEQAKIRCDYFLALQKTAEKKKVCPVCKQSTLEYESGCYEGGYGDYVYCDNDKVPYSEDGEEGFTDCEFSTENIDEFIEITAHFDFDVVLMMAGDIAQSKKDDTEIELSLGSSWHDFVEKDNQDILKETEKRNVSTT